MHTKQWILANTKVKALPLSVEGHVNSLIKVNLIINLLIPKSNNSYQYELVFAKNSFLGSD